MMVAMSRTPTIGMTVTNIKKVVSSIPRGGGEEQEVLNEKEGRKRRSRLRRARRG